jgi:transposase
VAEGVGAFRIGGDQAPERKPRRWTTLRRVRMLHDIPCFGRVTLLRWLVRIWRCREPQCATQTFSEAHGLAPPRMALTVRAVGWAADALSYDDTTVSALARHLGVDWHTCWDAIEVEATARTSDPVRLKGVRTLGVDEHIWRPSRIGVDRAVTIMVDLSRDQAGCLHARLLDAVVGRSGTVYKAWLKAQPEEFIDGVEQAALDPFRGYAVRHEARVIRVGWKDPPPGCRSSPVKLRAVGPVEVRRSGGKQP